MTLLNQLGDIVRDLPIIDFMDPYYEIKQVVMHDVKYDVNFASVPAVDRCTSCHLGISNSDYKNSPQPFTSHPNLDLFVSSSSKHPSGQVLQLSGQDSEIREPFHSKPQPNILIASEGMINDVSGAAGTTEDGALASPAQAIGLKMQVGESVYSGFDTNGTDFRLFIQQSIGSFGLGTNDDGEPQFTVGGHYNIFDNFVNFITNAWIN